MTRFERRSILGLGLAIIACVALIITIIVGSVTASTNTNRIGQLGKDTQALAQRVAADEHATCVIQSRGLPAGHHLSAVMFDLGVVLSHIPQRRTLTHRELETRLALIDLRQNARRYVRIERQQPATRQC